VRQLLLATCSAFADGDPDDRLLLDPLAASNVDASFAVWDDPGVDWTACPVVLRSTWDYPARRGDFLRWAGSVPQLYNPIELVEWNSDKVYLADLERGGVPVTPTTVALPGQDVPLPDDHEFVVKPSVGAGSRGVGRFRPAATAAAQQHVQALQDAGRTVLVQPYVADIDQHGETALIYLAGAFSHAIRKGAMLPDDTTHELNDPGAVFVEETVAARTASAAEVAVGDQAVAYVCERFGIVPLYARVDVLPAPSGPVVIELELIEPSLFLGHGGDAVDRFAACLAATT
jgi:hypothetical protein